MRSPEREPAIFRRARQGHKQPRPLAAGHKLNLGVMGMPSCWVVLEELLETTTMFGRRRLYQAFGLSPDDESGLRAAIESEKDALSQE